ncbi:hypothetical protein C8J57DRAFT_1584071 [Mycena rebaudengoi]|nr:hypothetical protein C8J57DRAFT_1584071 [Mycena rebaudengoi]
MSVRSKGHILDRWKTRTAAMQGAWRTQVWTLWPWGGARCGAASGGSRRAGCASTHYTRDTPCRPRQRDAVPSYASSVATPRSSLSPSRADPDPAAPARCGHAGGRADVHRADGVHAVRAHARVRAWGGGVGSWKRHKPTQAKRGKSAKAGAIGRRTTRRPTAIQKSNGKVLRRPRGRAEEVLKPETAVRWAGQAEHSFECKEKFLKQERFTGSENREKQEQGQQGERGEHAKGQRPGALKSTTGGGSTFNGVQKKIAVTYQCGGAFVVLCARPGAVGSAILDYYGPKIGDG